VKILAFVGLPLSGKSTAASVAKELGIPVIVMGDIIRKYAESRGIKPTRENLGKLASELRQIEGMDAVAKRCIPALKKALKKKGMVVIDGIRGVAEVERFKREFGDNFILINIEAGAERRLRRARKRGREDDVRTMDELMRRDEQELSWNMGEAMKIANYTIENNSSLEEFKKKIKDFLLKLIKKVEVTIATELYPTEDEEKVIKAVKNIFPDAKIEIKNNRLIACAENIERFRDLLRKQRILDTARSELLKNKKGNEITIYLNKQTATVSKINFADVDALLAPLKVTFKVYNIKVEKLVDYLAPETKNGKPIKEVEHL